MVGGRSANLFFISFLIILEGNNKEVKMKEEKKEKDDLKAEVRVSVRKGSLAPEYLSILKEAGGASGNYTIVVTSTARTPYDQARVMFENLERTGVPYQRRQYRQPGREVIAVYEELSDKKKDKGEILFAMEQKIKYLGPENVSKHCSDKGNVADVAKSTLSYPQEFLRALRPKVAQVLDENGCFHVVFF